VPPGLTVILLKEFVGEPDRLSVPLIMVDPPTDRPLLEVMVPAVMVKSSPTEAKAFKSTSPEVSVKLLATVVVPLKVAVLPEPMSMVKLLKLTAPGKTGAAPVNTVVPVELNVPRGFIDQTELPDPVTVMVLPPSFKVPPESTATLPNEASAPKVS